MKKNRCLMIGMVLMCLWWLGNAWCDVVFMVPNEKDSQPELKFINAAQLATGKFGKAIYFGKESDSTVAFPDQDALKLGKDNLRFPWLRPKTLKPKMNPFIDVSCSSMPAKRFLGAGCVPKWTIDVLDAGRCGSLREHKVGTGKPDRGEMAARGGGG